MTGRKTICTPELVAEVAQYIKLGMSNKDACVLTDISESVFYRWLERGRAELERRESPRVKEGTARWQREQPFVHFVESLRQAAVERKGQLLEVVFVEALNKRNWRAALELLRKLHGDEFGDRLTLAGDADEPVNVIFHDPDGKSGRQPPLAIPAPGRHNRGPDSLQGDSDRAAVGQDDAGGDEG